MQMRKAGGTGVSFQWVSQGHVDGESGVMVLQRFPVLCGTHIQPESTLIYWFLSFLLLSQWPFYILDSTSHNVL